MYGTTMAFPPALSIAMNIAQQEQQRKRAVSPPVAAAVASILAAAAAKREQSSNSDDTNGNDDEVQVVGTVASPSRQYSSGNHSGAPTSSYGRLKRDRSDEDDESPSSSPDAKRTARRISNAKEEQIGPSLAKLVLALLQTDDEAVLVKAIPNLLVALHEREQEKRLEKQQEFYQAGGHLAVVTVMHKHPHVQLLQQSGIIVLLHASYRNNVLRQAIGKVEGIQAILKAMKNFSQVRDVQFQGLQALVSLASEKPNGEMMVVRLQAMPFLLDKMKQYSEEEEILRWSCELLKRLARFNRLRRTIFEANAVDTLVIVMNSHKENVKIQKAAREAMKLLL